MNKKGFTLTEVLGIIVVLGLLAVIIGPKIINTIKNSKEKSYNVSVNNLVKALNSVAIDHKANLVSFDGCSYNFDTRINTCSDLGYSGELPTGGSVTVDRDGNVNGSVVYGNSTFEIRNNKYTSMSSGTEFAFDYTGGEQTFNVFTSGYYKLETWGAQGGDKDSTGGYGGYSIGIVNLNSADVLYINVGGQGAGALNIEGCVGSPVGICSGGYNGGGDSAYKTDGHWGAGGGATHIALKSGLLSTLNNDVDKILIVSGGGGGAYSSFSGGSAGGYVGNDGYLRDGYKQSLGGTQSTGGQGTLSGLFGMASSFPIGSANSTGGGSGFYGAGSVYATSSGGGSSYIGNSLLTNKYMTCFECQESDDVSTKTISVNDESKVTEEPISGNPKKGNGFVKITYLGQSID